MEKYVAVLFNKEQKNELNEYNKNINLIPKKIIIGKMDKQGYLITEDDCKFKCANMDTEDELFYMFPVKIEKLFSNLFEGEEVSEDNLGEMYDILLEEEIYLYFSIINDYCYFLKQDNCKYKLDCYMYNQDFFTTNIIDPNLDFYTVIDNLDESLEEIEEIEKTEEELLEEEYLPEINCLNLYDKITKTVLAQDEQIKQILIALKKHYLSESSKMKANILLAGKTGTGKTEILTQIAKYISVPIAILDSTQFTQEGYVGRSVDQALKELYESAGKNIEKTEKGILVFDEIDKKVGGNTETVATKAVLDSLLKILDGTNYYVPNVGKIDTSKIVFIGSGAFSKIQVAGEKVIGFNRSQIKKTYNDITPETFIKYGLSPEFMGRINELVLLNDLSVEDLINILLNSNKSTWLVNKNFLENLGISLKYEDEAIEKIARKAIELKSGARSLDPIVNNTLRCAFDEIFFTSDKNFNELVISEKTVDNPKVYKLY